MVLKRAVPFYFDPLAENLRVFLGPREAELMEIGWKHGPLTVKKALFYLDRKNAPAYTTVMTILGRLADKGLMNRKRAGRHFVYETAIDRSSFIKNRVKTVNDCIKKNFSKIK